MSNSPLIIQFSSSIINISVDDDVLILQGMHNLAVYTDERPLHCSSNLPIFVLPFIPNPSKVPDDRGMNVYITEGLCTYFRIL